MTIKWYIRIIFLLGVGIIMIIIIIYNIFWNNGRNTNDYRLRTITIGIIEFNSYNSKF